MTLSPGSIILLALGVLLTAAGLSTFLSTVFIAVWWLVRWMGLLPPQSRLSLLVERWLDRFRPNDSQAQVHKWYTWEFPTRPGLSRRLPGSRFFTELWVNRQRYLHFHQQPRQLSPSHFDSYVVLSTPEIETLAGQLTALGQTQRLSAYEQLCNTLAFVQQNIRYTDDLCVETGQLIEYPKFPLETLVEKRGDCEDQSILAAALLAAMGYEVALLILPIHVALGVAGFDNRPGSRVVHPANGLRYLYTETTAPNWLPGEVPLPFRGYLSSGQFEVLPVAARNDHRPLKP